MQNGLIEIVGAFVILVGFGAIVAAASLVSTALAVLTAGVFLVLIGIVACYGAATLSRAAKTRPGERP